MRPCIRPKASPPSPPAELRAETSELIEHVRKTGREVMVQKNNQPEAVLISWETYLKLKDKVDFDRL